MKEPIIYLLDNDLVSKFKIEITIRQSKRPCKIISFDRSDSAFGKLLSDSGQPRERPDIIIVNFDLPRRDGLSFLKAVERNGLLHERTALYVFSALRIPDGRRERVLPGRIKGYFTKPLDKKDIQRMFEDFEG